MNRFIFVAISCSIALTGCHTHNHEHAEDHHHDSSMQITAYSPTWEVYAEADPFTVGEEGSVLAHFSRLENFKPLTEGSVTANIEVSGKTVSQTLEHPTRIGIYKFFLSPDTEGEGTIRFDIGGESIISPIKVFSDKHDAEHYAADHQVSSSNGVVFTKEQSWEVDFGTSEVTLKPFGRIIKTVAKVLPSSSGEHIITALTDGIVSISGDLADGQKVRSGQQLFIVKSGAMADGNLAVKYSQARREYEIAKAEYERKLPLSAENIVSKSDFIQAKARYEAAKINWNNLKDNFNSDGQIVKAPVSGYLRGLTISNGSYVTAGQTLATVSIDGRQMLRAEVQARYASELQSICGANIRQMNSDRSWTLSELSGKIIGTAHAASEGSALLPVTLSIEGKAGFIPGEFVELYIRTGDLTDALTVPDDAIIEEMGNFFVYKQLTPEYFEKTQVNKGASDGIRTQILSGLTAGDRVVSKGAVLVKLAQAAGGLDAHSGHVH